MTGDDPWAPEADDVWYPPIYEAGDEHLATIAALLFEMGNERLLALLLDVDGLTYNDMGHRRATTGQTVQFLEAHLNAPPRVVVRLTDEDARQVKDLLGPLVYASRWKLPFGGETIGYQLERVLFVASHSDPDWRNTMAKALTGGPVNNATLVPRSADAPRVDGMFFRSASEVRVYGLLKKVADSLPKNESVGILVNPAMWLGTDLAREPDLVVTLRGRVGVVEIDGPLHRGRWANDQSRDRLLRRAGVAEIEHIAHDLPDDEIEEILRDFLRRLGWPNR